MCHVGCGATSGLGGTILNIEIYWFMDTMILANIHQDFLGFFRGWPTEALIPIVFSMHGRSSPLGTWDSSTDKTHHMGPKEYPQQPETKAADKHPRSEMNVSSTALITLFFGRALRGRKHRTHTLWKPPFQKRLQLWQLKGQYSRSSCEGFPQRTAAHLILHYLTFIIHISSILYITYIFYTIFSTSTSTSTSTFTSTTTSSMSISPTSYLHHLHIFPSTSSTWHTSSTIHSWPTSSSISLHPLHRLHLLS